MKDMKKIFALALAVLMTLSMAACGGNGNPTDETTDSTASTQGTSNNASEPDENLTIHENTFFTVGYKEEDGWTLAEDDFSIYDDGGNAYLRILDEDGDPACW